MRAPTRHATLALAVSLLAACGSGMSDAATTGPVDRPPPATASSPASAMTGDPTPGGDGPPSGTPSVAVGSYVDQATYQRSPGRYHTGKVVLFFHASWCPVCREVEESLTAAPLPSGLTVVKVDYDSQTALRRKYGVTIQHTFVQVDASGTRLARWTTSRTADEILAGTV